VAHEGGLMAEIDEFFVIPENRPQNIGAALLNIATAAKSDLQIWSPGSLRAHATYQILTARRHRS
jgi:hypothetical protein